MLQAPLLALALALGVAHRAPQGAANVSQDGAHRAFARLAGGPREVHVIDEGAGAAEALRVLRTAVLALPELERRAGFAPPCAAVVVHAWPDRERTGGYQGTHDGRAIHLAAGADAQTLVHELAHHWFGRGFVREADGAERWIVEGLCELVSVRALEALPELAEASATHARLCERWTPRAAPRPILASDAPPFPLARDDGEAARGWYTGAYAFFHLLEARVGAERLRALHRDLAAGGAPCERGAYAAALARIEPRFAELARGWLDRADFDPRMAPEACLDADGDGLSAAEERALGLDPARFDGDGDGAGDGFEVRVRRSDPRAPDAAPPYAIDGRADDWERERAGVRRRADATGDAERGFDLKAVALDADEDRVFALFTFAEPPAAGAIAALSLDADADGVFDVTVTAEPGGPVRVRRPLAPGDRGASEPQRLAHAAWDGARLELAVPRAALGLADPARARAYASALVDPIDGGERRYADEIGFWIAFPSW